jgi:hypothetical protein
VLVTTGKGGRSRKWPPRSARGWLVARTRSHVGRGASPPSPVTAVTNFCWFCRFCFWQPAAAAPDIALATLPAYGRVPIYQSFLTVFLLTLFPYSPDRWSKQRNTTTVSLYSPVLWDLGVLSVQRAWFLATLQNNMPTFPEHRIPSRAGAGRGVGRFILASRCKLHRCGCCGLPSPPLVSPSSRP